MPKLVPQHVTVHFNEVQIIWSEC